MLLGGAEGDSTAITSFPVPAELGPADLGFISVGEEPVGE